jgi:hypothetical protein
LQPGQIPIVTSERSTDSPDRGQVIRFRPRGGAPVSWRWPVPGTQQRNWADQNFAKYEQPETDEDYRHRMKMNLLGLTVTIVLMVVGAWLVTTLADIQKNQDCFLSGRRSCAPIPAPQRGYNAVPGHPGTALAAAAVEAPIRAQFSEGTGGQAPAVAGSSPRHRA